jgi:hypothetical protein
MNPTQPVKVSNKVSNAACVTHCSTRTPTYRSAGGMTHNMLVLAQGIEP